MNHSKYRLHQISTVLVFALLVIGLLGQQSARAQEASPFAQIKFPTVGFASVDKGKLLLKFTQISPPRIERHMVYVTYVTEMEWTDNVVPVTKYREESYTVTVPYTQMTTVNGKKVKVTKTRQETKIRRVPYQVMDPNRPKRMVPVIRMRSEKRKRKIRGKRVEKEVSIAPKDLVVRTIDGKKVDPKKAMSLLAEKTPVLILRPSDTLKPAMKMIAKPETLVVELGPFN